MKLYLASVGKSLKILEALRDRFSGIGILYSYADLKSALVKEANEMGISILFDSGAYSVKVKGIKISVSAYADFLLENRSKFETVTSLDVIGDEKGSIANYEFLCNKGLDVIPVWHFGESTDYLKYCFDNSDYVGLGGIATQRILDYKKLFDLIGRLFLRYPKAKFHLFGSSNVRILRQFPFYSADSSTWRGGSRFGWIMTPFGNHFIGWLDSLKFVPGMVEYLAERDIQFPFPKDDDPMKIDLLNIEYLYNELVVNGNNRNSYLISQSLF